MKVFITGGAGFIGSNAATHYASQGHDVTIFDNLCRKGAAINLSWLRSLHSSRIRLVKGDIRHREELNEALSEPFDVVIHLAGQTAVTCSVEDPVADFEANALGTLNLLEAVRAGTPDAVVLYASTNKVYGGLDGLNVTEGDSRYFFPDLPMGVSESYPLDFHSPYGCSKGAGDQYVRDYARIYGLRTVVFRQSCIYGPRQFGVEDQGWLAHFAIAAALGKPISIYGDGKQVRDILWVEDLLEAYDAAIERIETVKGSIFNVGGGPSNSLSVWVEFSEHLNENLGVLPSVDWGPWRPGDQKVFIADISLAARALEWQPRISTQEGTKRICDWVRQNRALFESG